MSDYQLYTYPDNPRALKILIASEYSSSSLSLPPFEFGKTNADRDFLDLFPLGRVPALKVSAGDGIADASAISVFLAGDDLYHGQGDVQKAKILQWMFYAESELWPLVCRVVYPAMGIDVAGGGRSNVLAKYAGALEMELEKLDAWFKFRTYLVTERLTLADVSVFSTLYLFFAFDKSGMVPVRVGRWFNTIKNQTEVQAALKKFSFTAVAAKTDGGKGALLEAFVACVSVYLC
jgi:elongation factor 1-gamma